ncbi:putative N-acetyltransferase 16 [Branchiostoma floridae x Branchiostoma japonicum]
MDDTKLPTLTEAKHSDYDAVMEIALTNTFRDGFDYLPARFHQYVDDPDVFMVLVERGGILEGINVYMFNDDGEALLLKTGRQNPRFRGKETSRRGRQSLPMIFKEFLLPRCKPTTLLQGVVEGHRMELRKLILEYMGFWGNEKCNLDVMYFQSEVSAINGSLASYNTTPLPPLTPYQPPDLQRLLPPAFSAAVLPEGRVLVDWDPYKLSESNMKKFVQAGLYILVDSTEPAAKSLSFGGSYMTPRGRLYHIDVHCKDEGLCKAHILNHVKKACSQYTGMITFCVMVIDQGLKETVMKCCVENLTLSHLPHDHTFTLYETDLTVMAKAAAKVKAKY